MSFTEYCQLDLRYEMIHIYSKKKKNLPQLMIYVREFVCQKTFYYKWKYALVWRLQGTMT